MPELEARLYALAADAVWPATPDLQAAVLAAAPPAPRPRRRPRRRRLLAAVVAALVLVPAAGAVAFPGARDDVLEFLGLRNVQIHRVPTPPPPAARPELEDDLGTLTTLAAAEQRLGFKALIPSALGPPDRVRVTHGRLSLVYAPRDGLPKLDGVDAGLVLTESPGGVRGQYLEKLAYTGSKVRRVRVDGHVGATIGGDHAYLYVGERGQVQEERPLVAGPTLLWEQGGLVMRLESRAKALQIARSVPG